MLEGLKVLDFSRYLPGPFASLRLAEWGAEVVKVESKPHGDPARKMMPYVHEAGAVYLACNHGKKSLFVDLKQEAGLHLVHELMARADVVIESFRPGVADQIGIGYQKARELNPQIVYCSLSGYGQSGTMQRFGGHDINYMAVSGMLDGIMGATDTPSVPDVTVADLAGGMAATEAILAATIRRFKTGEGAHLDVSLVDALLSWQGVNAMMTQSHGASLGGKLREVVSYQVYATQDGRWMAFGALEPKFWMNFCEAVGKQEWIPAHLSPAVEGEAIFEEMKALFRSHDFAYWTRLAGSIDACLTPVLTLTEALNSPLAAERGFLATARFLDEKVGVVRAVAGLSAEEAHISDLGEHSQKILSRWLGLDDAAIDEWKQKGVI
ncbi:MAG: CaiB/BaiF CoA-transferase family protein [Tumebacillaceae bacterium]